MSTIEYIFMILFTAADIYTDYKIGELVVSTISSIASNAIGQNPNKNFYLNFHDFRHAN